MHSRLIDTFKNIFNTRQIADLHDLLTKDFYFRNPRVEINGRDRYIHYVEDNHHLYTTETIDITAISETEYKRQYYLTFLDASKNNNDKLLIVEYITIRDNLISSSIVEYATDKVSDVTRSILDGAAENHGNAV